MTTLIKSSELCERLSISKPTEWRWRKAGVLPKPIKIRNQNFYLESTIDDLIERFRTDCKSVEVTL